MTGFGVLTIGDLGGPPTSRHDSPSGDPQRRLGQRVSGPCELASLIDETVALFRRLRDLAAEVYGESSLSGGHRNVLKELDGEGPRTVPEMARARGVSRQHVQSHVNELASLGYVELIENPAHKRSRRVRLTGEGKRFLVEMGRREERVLSSLDVAAGACAIESAVGTLRAVRESIERRFADSALGD